MTDEQLKTYFPSYGDRLAILGFADRKPVTGMTPITENQNFLSD